MLRAERDMQLVDLFSPEFNLKIGDLFTQSASEADPPLESAKEILGTSQDSYDTKLRCIVTEFLDRDIIQ